MKVLLIGASGFIGQSIVSNVPKHISLTGTYFNNKPQSKGACFEHLDYLAPGLEWSEIIDSFSCIIIAARASGSSVKERDVLSARSQAVFTKLIQAVQRSETKPFIVAVNGSLTYGHRGEEMVTTQDNINPVGFAKSYAIAEQPFRDYLAQNNGIAIIRAPWVLGPGSWFQQLYLSPKNVPIIGKGDQWMSIVALDKLAAFVWELVELKRNGVHHPALTARCRQQYFARAVQQITKKPTRKIGWYGLMRMEKQMRGSILASIKLDDGQETHPEAEFATIELNRVIKEIYSDFS